MKKKILAVALAATMVVASAFNAFAADSLVGSGWWTDTQTSTAQSIADGETVTFSVEVSSNDSVADGEYAAFCVEATDGTYYCTATSDGGIWGGADLADPATTATSTGAVAGGTYTVTITRSGNNWTVDMTDSTGTSLFTNELVLEGSVDFGDCTCYIMSQVADLTVDVVTASTDDTEEDTTTTAAADDDDDDDADATTTTTAAAADDSTETGDVATFATVAIVAAAAVAIVALRKRVTE
ncbi:MAG: hypothetical protein LUE29_08325 [Lachnospiraceae bacterium]|nr:hypothetical protein [Lachnospiraceae bacterium]